jgi:type I restriction enzyme S subunit
MTTPNMPPIDLSPLEWEIVRDILARYVPQYEVWAFGSRAKHIAREYSDLDLAIITDQPLDLTLSADIANAFEESDLPIKVDVVDWATTSENFRQIVLLDKIVIQNKLP